MKSIVVLFLTLLCTLNVFPVSISFGSEQENTQTITKVELEEFDLEEMIKAEDIEDLTLTIYYDPWDTLVFTQPWTIERIKKGGRTISLEGESLQNVLPLLYEIDNAKIEKVSKKTYVDAWVCYCLESSKNGTILEVAFWGDDNSIIVNGTPVHNNAAFYGILLEYLPENIWDRHIEYGFAKLSENK